MRNSVTGSVSWKSAAAAAVLLVAWPLQAVGHVSPISMQPVANSEIVDCWGGNNSWLPGTIQALKITSDIDIKTLFSNDRPDESSCAFV